MKPRKTIYRIVRLENGDFLLVQWLDVKYRWPIVHDMLIEAKHVDKLAVMLERYRESDSPFEVEITFAGV